MFLAEGGNTTPKNDSSVEKVAENGFEGHRTGEMNGVDQPSAKGPDDGRAGGHI